MHRVGLRHQLGNHRMTRFMVGSIALLVLRHHHAAALGAHHYLVLGFLEVFHVDQTFVGARCKQGRLVHQIGEIGTGKSRRSAGDDVGLDVA